ncbi:jg24628 [Pararge aegeria aegeria]|uniref:Jg24628 protein n=1 Tax=Pararge aegeria aegeria TaxID=348720 RepID=A0A8S4QUQ2_9NEOP|nr:jg24628 [Pararge aegeria aegeria]
MLNFTPLNKDTSANLTLFIETFDHSLKAIQALEIDNLDDYLICHLALRGLDTHTRKLFEESRDQKDIPKFSELVDFVNKQIKVLDHTFPQSSSNVAKTKQGSNNINLKGTQNLSSRQNSKSVLATSRVNRPNDENKLKLICPHCNQNHMIYRCEPFRKLSVDDRIDRVNSLRLCGNCLKSHDKSVCTSTWTCGVCAAPHHFLLHKDMGRASQVNTSAVPIKPPAQPTTSQAQQALVSARSVSDSTATQNVLCSNAENQYGVVLGTTRTHILDISGHYQDFRAVIDSGAQTSFISSECAQRLGLPRKKCPFSISGLGGEYIKNQGMVTCTIKPRRQDRPTLIVDMVVVAKVASEMPNVNFPCDVIKQYTRFNLADPKFYKRARVDILLGNDVVSEIIKSQPLFVNDKIPSVIETVFGSVISGKLIIDSKDQLNGAAQNYFLSITEDESLDKTLRAFWSIEEVPCTPSINPLDQLAEDIFVKEHSREPSGRYIVPLPRVPNHPPLGNSRTAAERRLLLTERRLARTPSLSQAYAAFMREYEALDHMELYVGAAPSKYIIPHHNILRPGSSSTPLRVVFDGSCRSTDNNISLNDILLTGPNLYRDISAIILNFRLFNYCLVCDVCKMYRAIRLKESDRGYQHILYRSSPTEAIKLYELKTVTYGLSCSPFLAIRTLIQLAQDEEERFPLAAQVIREGVYMDDILYSCNTYVEACTMQDQLIGIFESGQFLLKKWTSNNVELLERVPTDHRECPVTFIKDGNECTVKVLGLTWVPLSDNFVFSISKTDPVLTKRSVLKLLASIYDPVGFIAPCTFIAKSIMQELWKLGLGWDDPLPREIGDRWASYIAELPRLAEIPIARHMLLPGQTECELVGFCDASSRGYAACLYVISRNELGNVKVCLVAAKSKVAPVKPLTIPRLELMGAVLLSKLLRFICDNIKRVKITRITALTDATIVLSWLHTEAYKLKTFVCNRVTQITEVVPSYMWRHVNSENNLADVCSRGVSPSQLVAESSRWLQGPDWLYQPPTEWPVSVFIQDHESQPPELKLSQNLFAKQVILDQPETKAEFCERLLNRFSSYTKLQRSIAWILRFRNRIHAPIQSRCLNTEELNAAQEALIRLVQESYFTDEIDRLSKNITFIPSLKKLSPFLDAGGFLRVGGRITYSELPYNSKHPRLLPKDSLFTRLLIEYYHKKYLHVGPRTLQSILSEQYWILSARSIIRSVLSKCKVCFKNKPPLLQPEMAPLPPTRLLPHKVFEHVGVDLGGPFFVKEGLRRNARVSKSYLALFICFSTKAVHLELLSSLTADCFLGCLDRMVSRKGLCQTLYSDQGTNFIAASKHLTEVQRFLRDSEAILDGCAQRQISWKFNVPSAPHMGGLWEAGIKAAKYHLVRCVGDRSLTFEELSTVFCKVEAILNSRPLCPLPASDNPDEFNVLTAGHFLIGKGLTAVPEYNLEEVPVSRLSRWQYIQKSSQLFWKRWSREYLNTLQQRAKWFTSKGNLNVGDLVLIKTDNAPPCHWPLGRIEVLHPGADGIVRCVTLRTQKSRLQRPVNKLSPLPYVD